MSIIEIGLPEKISRYAQCSTILYSVISTAQANGWMWMNILHYYYHTLPEHFFCFLILDNKQGAVKKE